MRVTSLHVRNFKSFVDSSPLSIGPVNIFVGPNNAGKSALLRALYGIQEPFGQQHVRLQAEQATATIILAELEPTLLGVGEPFAATTGKLELLANASGGQLATLSTVNRKTSLGGVPDTEPHNFIYPFLARRKAAQFIENVAISTTNEVRPDLANLAAKVLRLADTTHPRHSRYVEACQKVLGIVPTSVASTGGQKPGLRTGTFDTIYIEELGEGVANVLGLITQLCVAEGRLLLVEEPENDIHPRALKALLELIAESSKKNQFVLTTHSHIVVKHLGALPETRIYNVDLVPGEPIPTSTVTALESPSQRLQALEDLGYDLLDFDLPEGFLILEESSAERLIRDYFIPWFAPWLSRLRTVSAGGTSKVGPTFEDFHRLFRFAHLQPRYEQRAWVVVDGDDDGRSVVAKLCHDYGSWGEQHFRTWDEKRFEAYYPAEFQERASAVFDISAKKARQEAKKQLLETLLSWIDEDLDRAKKEFEKSAAPVISVLQEIEANLLERRTPVETDTAGA